MTSRTGGTALSAARAGVAAIWCGTLMAAALTIDHPVGLLALLAAVIWAGWLAGAGEQLRKASRFSLPLALMVVGVNAIVSRDGVTVVAQLGEVPVLGRLDITLEGLVYGAVLGLRVVLVSLAAVLFTAVVDQDELLGLVRRRSGRFGLAASVAGRLMPLLAADGARMAEARKAVPKTLAISRFDLVSSIATGALDRAADAAAALELRGLGEGPCLAPRAHRPWSRHDFGLLISSVACCVVVAVALLGGWVDFQSASSIRAAWGFGLAVTALALPLVLVAPLFERRGVGQ